MLNILVALVGTAYVCYKDWKTGYMPDKVTHAMIAFGVVWALLFMQSNLINVFGLALIVFLISLAAYLFGQWGGGDVKLFTAIALLLPAYPQDLVPVMQSIGIQPVFASYPFVLAVFLFAGLLGPMLFTSLSYSWKLYNIRSKVKGYNKKMLTSAVYIVAFGLLFGVMYESISNVVLLFIPILTALMIVPFKDDILEHFSLEEKDILKLNDDDVIAVEFLSDSIKKKLNIWRKTFTNPEIRKIKELAKKAKIKRIKVYENLPTFGPFIFISLVVNLILGDIFLYFVFHSLA